MPAVLEGENLARDYGLARVFSNLNLQLNGGSIHLLTGPNGIGKTSLMQCLCGLARPATGRLILMGQVCPPDSFPLRQASYYAPHWTPLYPELPLEDNLQFYTSTRNLRWNKTKVLHLLEGLNLYEYLKLPAQFLSAGTRQKTALVYAFLSGAKLKFFDEPLAFLDEKSQAQVVDLFAAWKNAGDMLLVITHSTQPFQGKSDSILRLSKKGLEAHKLSSENFL